MWEFIVQYWAEWAFGLLGTAIIAVAIKYKALLDGVLAILHDRIYQACQHYIQQGYIDASGLKNLEYLYRSYHTLGGERDRNRIVQPGQSSPHPRQLIFNRKDNTMNNNHISAGTIARTAALALALTNQILSAAGKPVIPIDNAQLEQFITTGFTVGASIVNWWYNQSFTQAAIEGDKTYESVKNQIH